MSRIEVYELQPGERMVHDAVMEGLLGMPWWSAWVEHPPSSQIVMDLRGLKVCGCGRSSCTPSHGVKRKWLVPDNGHVRPGFVWVVIPYRERLRFLRDVIRDAARDAAERRGSS